jgi:hypothetical protein
MPHYPQAFLEDHGEAGSILVSVFEDPARDEREVVKHRPGADRRAYDTKNRQALGSEPTKG